jgi:hypothetical protein
MQTDDLGAAPYGDAHPFPARTSEVLRDLAYSDGERVTFGEILASLRHRAFGFAMLIFSLPSVLPMPPGIPTVCGAALAIIALNLIVMRRRLWLPAAITEKSIARAELQRVVDRVLPTLERLERFCRPRLQIFTDPAARVLVGVVVLVLGVVMILPIPFIGNIPPAIAAAVIAIGITERDGVVVLVGVVGAAVAIVVASTATWAVVLAIVHYFTAR